MQNNLDMKIAVFCSANDSIAPAYFKAAEELGKTVVEAFPDSEMAKIYDGLAAAVLRECGVELC